MVKDRKARSRNHLTVTALANVVVVIVDTMRNADVPNDVIWHFLDELEELNDLTLNGPAGEFMGFLVQTLKGVVPSND